MRSQGGDVRPVTRVAQKWGFGLAPVKAEVQAGRVVAGRTVAEVLQRGHQAALGRLDDLSTVRGLFTRTYKKDQWDWFTVCAQLGYPPAKEARRVSGTLHHLRHCLRDGDLAGAERDVAVLTDAGLPERISAFVAGTPLSPDGRGFVYVLSTREEPEMLKIGYTDRDPLTRAKEINSATGVIIPWGVRGAWTVPQARRVEAEVHGLLAEYRVRADREFFQLPFAEAARIIDGYVEQ